MSKNKLSNAYIKRIANSVGANKVSGLIYEHVRSMTTEYLETVISKAVTYSEFYGKNTINKGMIYLATDKEKWSENLPAVKCKIPNLKQLNTVEKRVEWYKKEQGENRCLHFPKSSFASFVKDIMKQMTSKKVNITKEAMIYLQYIVESYIASLLKNGLLFVKHRGSPVLMPKDLTVGKLYTKI